MELPQDIIAARSNYQTAAQSAANMAGDVFTIKDQLEKNINEALNYNKPFVENRATSLADYLAAPAAAEARYSVEKDQAGKINPNFIFNPFTRQNLIAQDVRAAEIPFLTNSALLGYVRGGTDKAVNAAANAFQAAAVKAQAQADLARNIYADLFSEYTTNRDFQEKVRQFNETMALEKEKVRKAGSGSGAGTATDLINILYNKLRGNTAQDKRPPLESFEEKDDLSARVDAYVKSKQGGGGQTPRLGEVPQSVTSGYGLYGPPAPQSAFIGPPAPQPFSLTSGNAPTFVAPTTLDISGILKNLRGK